MITGSYVPLELSCLLKGLNQYVGLLVILNKLYESIIQMNDRYRGLSSNFYMRGVYLAIVNLGR